MDVHLGTTSNKIDSKVKFSEICGLLERIQKKSGNDGKKQIFLDFLTKWRTANTSSGPSTAGTSSQGAHSSETQTSTQKWNSFYPVMRLLLPKLDTERPAYGIKEHTLAKHYIEILGLGKDSPDANRLLNYRAPTSGSTSATNSDSGDFAAVAYHVLQHRLPERGTLSIYDVNTTLDDIALGNISKTKDSVKQEMRIGLSETSLFSVFHPDAEQLFNVTSSLKRVCEDLIDPNKSLGEIEIKLFTPFRPMLADRILVNKVVQMISSNSFYVETKMDGERVQLHKNGSEFRYFSRSSKDFTSSYGKNDLAGSFTPFIARAFKPNVDSCVLDGEMMVYSTELQQFVTKGQKLDVKHVGKSSNVPATANTHNDDVIGERQLAREDTKQGLLQCYVVFDVLMLNGVVLSAKRLHERMAILKDVFDPIPERLRFVNQEVASTQDEVMSILNNAIDNREEGIIIKHPDSVYKPDKRKDSGWFKIKPDYEQGC